ncbi:MAG: SUMF1/EgtB/PvdO family nonheme iron enzyme [Blastocatellia bacterium]|nr:SUMF1/EgtB/PvdO family nonheme iron enzyme [Blastocatellia bacterium]
MYCEKCNVEFPEGLRYCKWCGQGLVERRRNTSELQTCPVCSAAVKSNWAFCKSCGVSLAELSGGDAAGVCSRCGSATVKGDLYCLQCGHELTRPFDPGKEKGDTQETPALIARCSSCGEALEAGFKYCKACGVPLPEGLVPRDSSSLLCGLCNRYSPAGSRSCVVCGASLEGAQSFSNAPTSEFHPRTQGRPDTLPDLADHLPDLGSQDLTTGTEEMASTPMPDVESEGATFIFERDEGTEEIASLSAPRDQEAGPEAFAYKETDLQPPGGATQMAAPGTVEMESPTSKSESQTDAKPGLPLQSDQSEQEQVPITVLIQKRKHASPVKEEGKTKEQKEASETVPIPDPAMETRVDIPSLTAPQREIFLTQKEAFVLEAETEQTATPTGSDLLDATESEAGPGSDEHISDEHISDEPPGLEATRQIGAGFLDFGSTQEESPFVQYPDHEEGGLSEPSAPPQEAPYAETFVFTGLEDEQTVPLSQEQAESLFDNAPQSFDESARQPEELQTESGTEMPFDTGSFGQRPPMRTGTHKQESSARPVSDLSAFSDRPPARPPEMTFAKSGAPVGAVRPAPRRKSVLIIALSAAAVLMMAVIVYAVWTFVLKDGGPEPGTQESPVTEAPPTPPSPPSPTAPAVPEGMVLVASGTYIIGRDDGDELGKPAYSVDLPAFYIDRTEVTNAAYKAFIDATGHKPPEGWEGGTYEEGQDEWPVTGVTWQDAADYAAWAGKRLPTEEEWEAAARGTDGRIYSWGNEFDSTRANIGTSGMKEVGQYENGASPAGALDMIGNVWEWTADEFKLYPNSPATPPNLDSGITYRVFRGGAYDGGKIHTASYRGFDDGKKSFPKTGFRCAKNAGDQ